MVVSGTSGGVAESWLAAATEAPGGMPICSPVLACIRNWTKQVGTRMGSSTKMWPMLDSHASKLLQPWSCGLGVSAVMRDGDLGGLVNMTLIISGS